MNHHVWLKAGPVTVALCSVLALGACSSSRFGGYGSSSAQAGAPMTPGMPEPVEPVPSGPVISEPLPPLDGQSPYYDGQNPYGTGVTDPSMGSDIAALPPATPRPTPSPTGRSSLVGGWSAQVASGGSCRVQLSSTPALDLYRASTSGCANQDLARVSAWDYREGEVYLYQSGGTVAARLRTSGGALNGVLAKSGAPLTLAR